MDFNLFTNNIPMFDILLGYLGYESLKVGVISVGLAGTWYGLGLIPKTTVHSLMYKTGKGISGACSALPYWDKWAEPIFIRQFGLLFNAGHGLLEGMISDNTDDGKTIEMLNVVEEDIIDKINEK